MVEHILNDLDYTPQCLFEPFSGTGATELVCANKGISSFAYDVNPFLVWLASTKTAFYTNVQILEFVEEYTHILSIVDGADEYAYPNIFHIERWRHKRQLSFLAKLKTCIWSVNDKVVADLLKVAFCREIIALSNAAFNHVSTSFGDSEDDSNLLPDYLFNIADNISKAENRSAGLMANYVLKYFDDMAIHIQSVYNAIQPGGTVHYIVGNSNFYGNSVPSEKIYTDILSSVGFVNAKYTVVRKRNCNKALFEYWISAKKV